MAKKIYYAQQEWQNDHYYLGVTDAGLAFVGSANQSIEELKNWYPQAQLEASEKKTAPYKEALISYLNQHSPHRHRRNALSKRSLAGVARNTLW